MPLRDIPLLLGTIFAVVFFTAVLKVFPQIPVPKISEEILYVTPIPEEARPVIVSPESDGILSKIPDSFKWKNGGIKNQVQISFKHAFSKIYFDEIVTGSNFVYKTLTDKELKPGVYFWRVRDVSLPSQKGKWSLKSCFVLGPIPGTVSAPAPFRPVYERIGISETNAIPPQTFRWSLVSYDPYCFSYAKMYLMEVASDPYFKEILHASQTSNDRIEILDTEKFSENLIKGAASVPFYWRVKAVDEWGKESSWSSVSNFYLVDLKVSTL